MCTNLFRSVVQRRHELIVLDMLCRYWYWFTFINFLRYAFSALVINQFTAAGDPPLTEFQSALEYFDMVGRSKWAQLGYEAIFIIFFLTCAWTALSYIKWQKR